MATILLSEYAARNGRAVNTVVQMANRGSFQTARKIGRQWFIEENEEYPDLRVKNGNYIGLRARRRSRNSMAGKATVEENNTQPTDKRPPRGE